MTITLADILKIRNDADKIGFPEESIPEAISEVAKDLQFGWYKEKSAEKNVDYTVYLFDINKIIPESQIINLVCYKALFMFYRAISPNIIGNNSDRQNPFISQRDYFNLEYEKELKKILDRGLDYDWNQDGEISADEMTTGTAVKYYELDWRLVR